MAYENTMVLANEMRTLIDTDYHIHHSHLTWDYNISCGKYTMASVDTISNSEGKKWKRVFGCQGLI